MTISILAQAENSNFLATLANVFSRPATLAQPTDLTEDLAHMSIVWAVVFFAAGIVTLLHGYRFYKTVTVIMALLIGSVAGYYLGNTIESAPIVAACLGILLPVVAFPLMKYAVAIMGGLAGAFVGANTWFAAAQLLNDPARTQSMEDNVWVGALIGVIVLGMLSFILFKLCVVVFTSVSGSTLAVIGAIALLLQVPGINQNVQQSITAHPVVVPLLVLVPAIIGLIWQETQNTGAPEKA